MKKILPLLTGLLLLSGNTELRASDFEVNGGYYTITSMNNLHVNLDSVAFSTEEFNLVNKVDFNSRTMTVTSISEKSFTKAVGLKKLTIESDIELPASMLSGLKNFESLIFLSNIDTIPQNFCKDCESLKSLQLSQSISILDDGCFDGCKSLDFFTTIPSQIISIGKNSLRNNAIDIKNMIIADASESLYISDWSTNGIYPTKLYLGRNLISDNNLNLGKAITEITYSNNVNSLPDAFFYYNDKITTINLPEKLTEIPYRCFYDCDNLTNIVLPNSIKEIKKEAFAYSGLSVFNTPTNLIKIEERAFYNTKIKDLKFNCPIESIGDEAFNKVQNVILPPSLKTLEANTFGDLNTLIIQESTDTLWLGTKVLQSQTISYGSSNTDKTQAESTPGVYAWYLEDLSSHSVNNLAIGRPVIGRKNSYKTGDSDVETGENYYYKYNNRYFYYPVVVNKNVKELTLGSIFKDTNVIVKPDTIINTSYVKKNWRTTYEYIDRCYLVYSPLLNPEVYDSIEIINVLSPTPPTLYADFPNKVYINATLRVPVGSKSKYESADYWKGFWNIEEVDFSSQNIWNNLPISVSSVSITPDKVYIAVNEEFQLTATVLPEEATNKNVTWTSSNPNRVTVTDEGVITGVSSGYSYITATCGDVSSKIEVNVVNLNIKLNSKTAEIPLGEDLQLIATISPSTTNEQHITWETSDPKVVSIDQNGLVKSLSLGNAEITAKVGEATATCSITVIPIMAEEIILNVTEATLTVGEMIELEATVLPENTTEPTVIWTSSNSEVATVSETGLVTALSVGSSIMTASCGDVSAECLITVLEDAGIDSLLPNPDSKISIYSAEGILIKKDCKAEDLKSMAKGIYIIVSGKDRYKITI